MSKSKVFLAIIVFEWLVVIVMLSHGQLSYYLKDKEQLVSRKNLVSKLGLTDFSIWTEARYTRHPSQADFFSPFQNFPGAFEHFPAGAIIAPPSHLWERVSE